MDNDIFKPDTLCELHSLKIGANGHLVFSNVASPEVKVFVLLDIWCFHFSENFSNVTFPLLLDSISLVKMRCNNGHLLVLKSKERLLKLNVLSLPIKNEQAFEFKQGLQLASPNLSSTLSSEADIILEWLLFANQLEQPPLPGLPAIAVLTDSILHYLHHFSSNPANFKIQRLTSLFGRYMDYEINEAQYIFELERLKTSVS